MKTQHNWMRRLLALTSLLLVCIVLFAACNSGDSQPTEPSPPTETSKLTDESKPTEETKPTDKETDEGNDQTEPHVHAWSAWAVTTAPTCTVAGEESRSCSCGEVEKKAVEATGHSFGEWETTTEPTCTEKGEQKRECACGEVETKSISATGHSYDTVVTKPTCTERGYTTYTCSCGDSYIDNYVSATGHSFDGWKTTKEPTCTEKGEQKRECICGEVETKSVSATGHSYDAVVTKPTCTERGYTTYTCSCGDSYADNYVSATGHSFGEWKTTKEATCTEKGEQKRECACGEVETKAIESKGHNEVIDEAVAATCTKAGLTEGKHCSVCNTILAAQTEVPMIAHSYDNKYDETCNECGFVRAAECAHINTTVIAGKAPTCTDSGLTDGSKCTKCGEILVEQEVIKANGHTEVIDKAVAPTCTETGLTEGKHCSVCNTVLTTQEVVSSKGHSYNSTVTEPTCVERGYTTYTCSCGESYVDNYLNANGHKYDDGKIITVATCTSEGTKKYSCTIPNCNFTYTESYSLPIYTAAEIYNQAIKYVGEIVTYDRKGSVLSIGTGFIISSDGKIVTNYHVIEGAYSAKITIGGTTYNISSVLAYDAHIDLAVLKINAIGLTAAVICQNTVNVGDTVYAIGSSRGLTDTFSQGIITYANRMLDGVNHIQHDASITHGNSGGPLINVYGEVIGINTWGIPDSQNLNFAVFSDELDNLVYRTPMSLAEFYELTNNAFDKLVDFILANGKYDSGNGKTELILEDGYNSSRTEYTIVQFDYNPKYNSVDLTFFIGFEDSNVSFFTAISLEKNVNSYYYAMYVIMDSLTTHTISGYIDYETFTENTVLGYNSYKGEISQIDLTRENASICAIYIIEYLEWVAVNYLDASLADFGFTSF